MRRKGDSKVLENQVKMQQNSHLHGADNPTYLKSGSDKVSAPRSESQSQSLFLFFKHLTPSLLMVTAAIYCFAGVTFLESQGVCLSTVSTRYHMDHFFFLHI